MLEHELEVAHHVQQKLELETKVKELEEQLAEEQARYVSVSERERTEFVNRIEDLETEKHNILLPTIDSLHAQIKKLQQDNEQYVLHNMKCNELIKQLQNQLKDAEAHKRKLKLTIAVQEHTNVKYRNQIVNLQKDLNSKNDIVQHALSVKTHAEEELKYAKTIEQTQKKFTGRLELKTRSDEIKIEHLSNKVKQYEKEIQQLHEVALIREQVINELTNRNKILFYQGKHNQSIHITNHSEKEKQLLNTIRDQLTLMHQTAAKI